MKRLKKEDRAGLYITVIVHLTVIIILLASQLSFTLRKEESFLLDFSKQETIEKLEKELALKEGISRRLDEIIASQGGSVPVRNVVVDRGALKDDRNTDAEQLYKDAERLQKALDNTFNREDNPDEYVPVNPSNNDGVLQSGRAQGQPPAHSRLPLHGSGRSDRHHHRRQCRQRPDSQDRRECLYQRFVPAQFRNKGGAFGQILGLPHRPCTSGRKYSLCLHRTVTILWGFMASSNVSSMSRNR